MTEPETTEPVETTGDPATGDPEPSFVNPDGTFNEGWQAHYVPEDFQGRTIYDGFTNIGDVMKKVGNQEKVLSRGDRTVSALPEDASQTERDEFYEALGRPKTAEEYKLPIADDIKEYVRPDLLEKGRAMMHEAGLSQKQAERVMQFEHDRIALGLEEMARSGEAEQKETQAALEEKWGVDAYNDRMHFAKRLVEDNTTPENKQALLDAIGSNQHILEFVAEFGMKFKEAKRIDPDGTAKSVLTKQDHLGRARELMETPGYTKGTLPPAQMERLQKEIREHYRAAEETPDTF